MALAAGPYPPRFLTPDPGGAWGRLGDELAAVAATPPDQVRAALEDCHPRLLPAPLRPLYEDPAAHLPAVVDELAAYWRVALEPAWPRIRTVCTADVSHRADQLAAGGLARLFGGLHPRVSYPGDRLLVDDGRPGRRRTDPGGAGLALVPCAFSWPTPAAGRGGTGPAWLAYPPRGVGLLWRPAAAPEQASALPALIGRTRASLLASLGLPATTTDLARRLDLSAAAVSQHLRVLHGSGLASARRRGKLVLYQRTAAANALLAATGEADRW